MAPWDTIEIHLHHLEIGNYRGKTGADEIRQVAVVVVGSDIDLIGLRQRGYFHRLQEAVPDRVDDRHIDRLMIEEMPILAAPGQMLKRSDRRACRLPDGGQRLRIIGIDLE